MAGSITNLLYFIDDNRNQSYPDSRQQYFLVFVYVVINWWHFPWVSLKIIANDEYIKYIKSTDSPWCSQMASKDQLFKDNGKRKKFNCFHFISPPFICFNSLIDSSKLMKGIKLLSFFKRMREWERERESFFLVLLSVIFPITNYNL